MLTYKRICSGIYEASNGARITYAPAPADFWYILLPYNDQAHDAYPTLKAAKRDLQAWQSAKEGYCD